MTQHDERDGDIGGEPTSRPGSGLVSWAVRTAAAAGLVCILATHFLAGATTPDRAAALRVARAPGALKDPETTGSIAARSVRLDPCAAPIRGSKP